MPRTAALRQKLPFGSQDPTPPLPESRINSDWGMSKCATFGLTQLVIEARALNRLARHSPLYSNPFAFRTAWEGGEERNVTSAVAASALLLPVTIPGVNWV